MTHRTKSYTPNVIYRKGDIVKDLVDFIGLPNRHGSDILVPQCFGNNIAHVSRLTQQLYRNFPELQANTEIFISNAKNFGRTQFIEIHNKNNKNFNKIIFANMLCNKITSHKRKIDYISLARCMSEISIYLKNRQKQTENDKTQIIGAKFGTGFLGGNWTFIEQLINDSWDWLTTIIYHYDSETTR